MINIREPNLNSFFIALIDTWSYLCLISTVTKLAKQRSWMSWFQVKTSCSKRWSFIASRGNFPGRPSHCRTWSCPSLCRTWSARRPSRSRGRCAAIITRPGASLQGLLACLLQEQVMIAAAATASPSGPLSTRCLPGLWVNWLNFKITIFVTVESKFLQSKFYKPLKMVFGIKILAQISSIKCMSDPVYLLDC